MRGAYWLALLGFLAGCGVSGGGARAVLTVTATDKVAQYDMFLRDDTSHKVILHTGWSDATVGGKHDLVDSPLTIGLILPAAGKYSVAIAGAIGQTAAMHPFLVGDARGFYWAGQLDVAEGVVDVDARLIEVPRPDDTDIDLFPDAAAWPLDKPEAKAIPMALLDCQDGNPNINPFAKELCGNTLDDDCDGSDAACVDSDGDGDPDDTDCDPMDPKRHHPNMKDPFPESPNCCGYALGKMGMDAHQAFPMDPACHAGTCDDKIDQDCDGTDRPCERDGDCDEFTAGGMQPNGCMSPANVPPGNDCDDCDPAINIQAVEACDGKDNNCNGVADETCVSCDLDGDGYQRNDKKNNCPDPKTDKHPGMTDCNDEDAGVYPGSTATPIAVPNNKSTCNGAEGGTVACALRGACQNKNPDGSQQDADCDGTAWKGCPMNDADGDGFPMGADCNDNDPHVFPNAPDKCGDGVAQNCSQDTACGTDADADGYDTTTDCNDNDPAIHPWAIEKCNGKDDDCDGLTDEGNPDDMGKPMVLNGKTLSCSDSNVGACAMPHGRCVCSASSEETLLFDQMMRNKCPNEDAAVDTGARKTDHAPRCYFAAQPGPELCDNIDNDCNGATPDGNTQCPGPKDKAPICCTGACVDAMTDVNNCNGCGMVCVPPPHATPKCAMGVCGVGACAAPWADCNAMAIDGCETNLDGDVANCGLCGNACKPPPNAANATCVNGKCGLGACNPGFADCDKQVANGCEINVSNDVNNCGSCGKTCSVNNGMASCAMGTCAIGSCQAPFADCNMMGGDGCEVNLSNDANNCGMCGKVCMLANATAGCAVSACTVAMCNAGFGNCNNMAADGCEKNLTNDVANCGTCGKVCPNGANATAGCANSACNQSCNAGFNNCDGNLANGCESTAATYVNNCGGCGMKCLLANATPKCMGGMCAIMSCMGMFKDCDTMAANGCEVNGGTDVNNCGACNMKCPAPANATAGCSAGVCGIGTCNMGFGDCDSMAGNGCEKTLSSDANNCGACGNKCNTTTNPGKLCLSGTCGCNVLSDCVGMSADSCTNNVCHCGNGAGCDTSTKQCTNGACLLKGGEPCMNSQECASMNCHGNPLKC